MTFNPQVKQSNFTRDNPKPGLTPARCIRVIELGKQDTMYGEKDSVELWYSIPNQTIEINGEQKQRVISTGRLTLSSNEKATLMKHVSAVNPAATNLGELVGKPCMINVVINKVGDKEYANIDSVVPAMEGIEIPEPDMPTYYFEFNNPNKDVWDTFSEYKQDKIKSASNWGDIEDRLFNQ